LRWITTANWVVSLVAVLAYWMLFVFHASDPSTPDRFFLVFCLVIGTPFAIFLGIVGIIDTVLRKNWSGLIESIIGPIAIMVNYIALSQDLIPGAWKNGKTAGTILTSSVLVLLFVGAVWMHMKSSQRTPS